MKKKFLTHLSAQRRIQLAFGLGVTYMVLIFLGGLASGSLALVADAGHMLGHSLALFVALISSVMAERESRKDHHYDYRKLEALGGYTNGFLLLMIAGGVAYEAISRSHGEHAHTIDATFMGQVALLGLALHALGALVLYGGRRESLNVHALYLHLLFDVAGTVIAFFTSVAIHMTGQVELDSFSSLLLAGLIGFSAIRMLFRSGRYLAGMDKSLFDKNEIDKTLRQVDHVQDVHNIVISPMGRGKYGVSAHIVLESSCLDGNHWNTCRLQAEERLKSQYGFNYVLLQLEAHG